MIYYRCNKKRLEEFQNKQDRDLFIYPNKDDLRNYAFTIIYENGINEVEQVIRTSDLKNHYLATKLLYKKSKYLSKFVSYQEASSPILNNFMESLSEKGNSILLNMVPFTSEELGGVLFLSKGDYSKSFLSSHLDSLLKFNDMSIYLCNGQNEIISECEFGQNLHGEVLQKILGQNHK